MHKVKKSLVIAALAVSTVAQAAKVKEPGWFKNVFVTLNPTVKVTGPVLDPQSTASQQYVDTVFKMALQETHSYAKRYLTTKEYKKYYALMLMGLTVPMHEGLFIHFKKSVNANGNCAEKRNSGDKLKDQGKTRKHFRAAFFHDTVVKKEVTKKVDGKDVKKTVNVVKTDYNKSFLTSCSRLKANQPIMQMIAGGGDSSDIGIMQLSARWHYEDFLAKGKFKTVRDTLKYGNSFLFRGYNAISRNASKYKCLLKSDGTLNHLKLARGVWGGWYNAGGTDLKRVCRFANPKSEHVGKDKGFESNLTNMINVGMKNATFGLGDGGFVYPAIGQKSRTVIKEIVTNLYAGTNTNKANLEAILK